MNTGHKQKELVQIDDWNTWLFSHEKIPFCAILSIISPFFWGEGGYIMFDMYPSEARRDIVVVFTIVSKF